MNIMSISLQTYPTRQIDMDTKEEIGARLIRLRKAWGYDEAKAFAAWLGIDEGTWNHYERARREPTFRNALLICNKTGASLDWIFRGLDHTLPDHVLERLKRTPEQGIAPPRVRLAVND